MALFVIEGVFKQSIRQFVLKKLDQHGRASKMISQRITSILSIKRNIIMNLQVHLFFVLVCMSVIIAGPVNNGLAAQRASVTVIENGTSVPEYYKARVIVTGLGKPPRRALSAPQKRLLAERAARVDAYKNLLRAVGSMESNLYKGSGVIQSDGYINGVQIREYRYYSDGSVELDLALNVRMLPGNKPLPASVKAANYSVKDKGKEYTVKKQTHEISKNEWLKLYKG
ncbi:MAG: hypothetical protein P9M03_05175 [Candidatus Theseobacter exili]|nr:hypothetical protein [Candidatus Theseobacter exili]